MIHLATEVPIFIMWRCWSMSMLPYSNDRGASFISSLRFAETKTKTRRPRRQNFWVAVVKCSRSRRNRDGFVLVELTILLGYFITVSEKLVLQFLMLSLISTVITPIYYRIILYFTIKY